MTFPLMALAVGAIVAGLVGIPAVLGGGNGIEHFLEHFTRAEFHARSTPPRLPARRRPAGPGKPNQRKRKRTGSSSA